MREQLNYLLSRHPAIYEEILWLKGDVNLEKVLFLNLVSNGYVVFDIGANRGYYTLLFSHLVGDTGEVHAFEPVPPTFGHLTNEIAANKRFDNVVLNNVAISDVAGKAKLFLPDKDDGQASLRRHSSGSWQNICTVTEFECEAVRLDDYTAAHTLGRLDFIKCDIEGAELLALKGAQSTLARFRPIISLEICPNWTSNFKYSPTEIVSFLNGFGYSNYYLVTNGLCLMENPLEALGSEKFNGSANMLCMTPELHLEKGVSLVSRYLAQ